MGIAKLLTNCSKIPSSRNGVLNGCETWKLYILGAGIAKSDEICASTSTSYCRGVHLSNGSYHTWIFNILQEDLRDDHAGMGSDLGGLPLGDCSLSSQSWWSVGSRGTAWVLRVFLSIFGHESMYWLLNCEICDRIDMSLHGRGP